MHIVGQDHYLLQFFETEHMPDGLTTISQPFFDLANAINRSLDDNQEKTICLRKLMEARDSALRSAMMR